MDFTAHNAVFTAHGFASIATDRKLRLHDRAGNVLHESKALAGGHKLTALAALDGGTRVVLGTTKLSVHDAADGRRLEQLDGATKKGVFTDVVVLGDGAIVSSARFEATSADNGLLVRRAGAVERIVLPGLQGQPCEVERLVRAPRTDTLFCIAYSRGGADEPHATLLFRVEPGGAVHRLAQLRGLLPGQTQLAASDARVFVTDAPGDGAGHAVRAFSWDGAPLGELAAGSINPALAVSPDGRTLALAKGEALELLDAATLTARTTLELPFRIAARLAFDASGAEFLCAGTHGVDRLSVPLP
ncbi:MAG: hypothetical protein ACOZQL_04190 [Myxococcota bacterium]